MPSEPRNLHWERIYDDFNEVHGGIRCDTFVALIESGYIYRSVMTWGDSVAIINDTYIPVEH